MSHKAQHTNEYITIKTSKNQNFTDSSFFTIPFSGCSGHLKASKNPLIFGIPKRGDPVWAFLRSALLMSGFYRVVLSLSATRGQDDVGVFFIGHESQVH